MGRNSFALRANLPPFATLLRLLGLSGDLRRANVPSLYDYTGTTYQGDPTGSHSSDKALRQMAADCTGLGVIGFANKGKWVHDGLPLDFWNGSGMVTGDHVESNVPGQWGCTIIRPNSAYNLEVPFPIHSGNVFQFNVHYPDRLSDTAAHLNSVGVGSPTRFAPTFAVDHGSNQAGQVAGGVQINFFSIDSCVTGGTLAAMLREAELVADAEWNISPATGRQYSYQTGKPTGAYDVLLRGMCMDGMVKRGGVAISCDVTFNRRGAGPQYWLDAQNQLNQVLMRYVQANAFGTHFAHRAVGASMGGALRGHAYGIICEAGAPPVGRVSANPLWAAAGSPDDGKFNASFWKLGTEAVPTLVWVKDNAFLLGNHMEFDARCKDPYDSSNVRPVFKFDTDKDKAGRLLKDSSWVPVTNYGNSANINAAVKIASGPILVNNANGPQGQFNFRGDKLAFSAWNNNNRNGTTQAAYAIQHLSAANNMILNFIGAVFNNGGYGNDRVFWGTADLTGTADTNLNYGQIAGLRLESMIYRGYTGSNYSHLCNIQPFDGRGDFYPVGIPDDSDPDDGDPGD